ncbi:uncharacterized protein LOC124279695 isoform X1 [Haliotis rubra]|uniref:uncharacterized protein LOC124279695 isoform X1 n=1 Tax=Haliotis rubra TaxID=36100 RepID=UPI001EE5C713|nr:uncharacterized protein LOC124279695 isoform X1 [Haliotis rubra]XP_046571484.1 uncharacterized protein LOC124279695 isoform X1 [Haliotis rubra]
MTDGCDVCEEAVKHVTTAETVITFHMERTVVYGSGRKATNLKTRRKELLAKFCNHVCALRNSGGGFLLIHFTGNKETGSRDLNAFDELVDLRLNAMIEDDTLFVDNYERSWLNDRVVILKVKSSPSCSTSDFKTKIPLDDRLIDPSARNIPNLYNLTPGDRTPMLPPQPQVLIDWSQDVVALHESRSIEMKCWGIGFVVPSDVERKALLIWETLKLRENITAMTKLIRGGSFYCGIEEELVDTGDYKLKKSKVCGMTLTEGEREDLSRILLHKVQTDMMWTNRTNESIGPPVDAIQILFHKVREETFVMEVVITFFDGLVFYDKAGPECYVVNSDLTPRRVEFSEWIQRVRPE